MGLLALLSVVVAFTVCVNVTVDKATSGRIYADVDSAPHNRVALLLGTNPLNRWGRPNSYFTNRVYTAADLYHAGKVDYIIASGDNHIATYDEPTAMRDSLVALGVPAHRIILDFAGFRTLDSVVRAKDVFGCDSLTIISQADHNARALYLAQANGIEAIAVSAPLHAGRWVRTRLAIREWLARDKMMLDLWLGKQPHFRGEKIEIPRIPQQTCRSTHPGVTMKIANLETLPAQVDSLIVAVDNETDHWVRFGEMYTLEKEIDGQWNAMPYNRKYEDGECVMIFSCIAYLYAPHSVHDNVNYTDAYSRKFDRGRYRLTKTFAIDTPELRHHNDTISVEFEITR